MIADFRGVLAAFVAHSVRFFVVGGHALAAHGVPRVTEDLDFWVDLEETNGSRVWRALAVFGALLASLGIRESDFSSPEQAVRISLQPYQIDTMTSISGVDFAEAQQGVLEGTLFDVPVGFIGRDVSLRNKLASGRRKDLADILVLGEPGDP